MLVNYTTRLIPTGVNVVTLEKDEMFYFIDRLTYNNCVVLSHLKTVEEVIDALAITNEEKIEQVYWLHEQLPKPISILAPFIGLVNDEVDYEIDDCVKVLHVITSYISPLKYLEVDISVRRDVEFSINILEEAELSMETAIADMIEYDVMLKAIKNTNITQAQNYQYSEGNTSTSSQVSASLPTGVSYADMTEEETLAFPINEDTPEEFFIENPFWMELQDGMYMHIDTQDVMSFERETEETSVPEVTTTVTPVKVEAPTTPVVMPTETISSEKPVPSLRNRLID